MKKLILLPLFLLLFSCNTNENSEQLEFPTVDKIKSDLLTRELDHWRFENLNEFETFTIKNQALSEDNKSVSISCETELIDLSSSEKQRGEIIVKYNFIDNNIWEFVSVTGSIDDIANNNDGTNDQNNDGDLDVPQSRISPDNTTDNETNSNETSNDEGDSKQNDKIRYINCQWCSNKFKVIKESGKTILGVIEYWEGGALYCNESDKNEQKKRTNQALDFFFNGIPAAKYCSKKCACDAYNNR